MSPMGRIGPIRSHARAEPVACSLNHFRFSGFRRYGFRRLAFPGSRFRSCFSGFRLFLPRHGAFLSTNLPSLLQCTAAIVRQMPALSAGGKSACGQENPQNSGMSVSASIWYHFLCKIFCEEFVKKDDADASHGAAWSRPAGSIVTRRPWQTGGTMRYIEITGR